MLVCPVLFLAAVSTDTSCALCLSLQLSRLRDVREGAVRVLGVDVRDVRQKDLRRVVVALAQSATLFKCSIKTNLLLGCKRGTVLDPIHHHCHHEPWRHT